MRARQGSGRAAGEKGATASGWRAPYDATDPRRRGAASSPNRPHRPAATSSGTATGSSTPPPSGGLKHKTQVFVHHEGDHYPHPPDPQPGSLADRPGARPRARPRRGIWPRPSALSHDLGTPASGTPVRTRWMPAWRLWRVRSQRPGRSLIVTRLERRYAGSTANRHLWETLEGLREAQRAAPHGPRPSPDAALRRAGHPRGDPRIRPSLDPLDLARPCRSGGAGRPLSPTTSPTPPMTSMMACAPAVRSRRPAGGCPSSRASRRDRGAAIGAGGGAGGSRTGPAGFHPLRGGCDPGRARGASPP